jgi:uncharacterized protein (DUF697 family)
MRMLQELVDGLKQPQDMSPQERSEAASRLIHTCGYGVAALTLIPVPFSETVAAVPVHVAMVVGLGRLYGEELNRDRAVAFVTRVGATVGLSMVGTRLAGLAIGAAKVILPVAGGFLGAPFMFASTLALGAVARAHFEHQDELSDDEIRDIYRDTLKRARKEYDPRRAREPESQDLAREAAQPEAAPQPAPEADAPASAEDPVERLARLKALVDQGLLEPEEYEQAKRQVLDGL